MKKSSFLDTVGSALYSVRSVMSLYYAGLIIIMLLMLISFAKEVYKFAVLVLSDETEKKALIIKGLELVDMVMVAQLVWVVALAGFVLFVTSSHFKNQEVEKPDWLTHVNTYNLKLKLAFSLISISGVHLLKTSLNASSVSEAVYVALSTHGVFVISAVCIAFAEKLTRTGAHKEE